MTIRVTRVAAQVGGTTGPALRVTRVAAQVAGTITPNMRVTKVAAEVAGLPIATTLKVTDLILQIATSETVDQRKWTARLGTNNSTLIGSTVGLGIAEDPQEATAGAIERTASDTISIGETSELQQVIFEVTTSDTIVITEANTFEYFTPLSATDAITITDSGARFGSLSVSADDSVSVTEVAHPVAPWHLTSEDDITITDLGQSHLLSRTASDYITILEASHLADSFEVSASDTILVFGQAQAGVITRTASDTIDVSEFAYNGFVAGSAFVLTAADTVSISEENNHFVILSTAIPLSHTDVITITERAIFPIFLTSQDGISISDTAIQEPGLGSTDNIEITESAYVNTVQARTASDTVDVGQAFTFEHLDSTGEAVSRTGACNVTQQYTPFVGAGPDSNPPPPPTIPQPLERKNEVILFYPTTGQICSATHAFVLRTPNFGNRDRTQVSRINRESRGGSLTIFRDPQWPSQRSLVMDFSGIKEDETSDLLAFLDNTLGLLVGFRDWGGQVWYGIITNPSSPIIRTKASGNDIALELEVQESYPDRGACDTITITEVSDVEKVSP